MVQKLEVEVDNLELLKHYLQSAITTSLDGKHEEIAVKILDRTLEHFSLHVPTAFFPWEKHFPVILIGGWYKPEDDKPRKHFVGDPSMWKTFNQVDAAVEYVLAVLKEKGEGWCKEFVEKFGEGYYNGFSRFDGLASTGYKLQTCGSFPQVLGISIIHVYYGK